MTNSSTTAMMSTLFLAESNLSDFKYNCSTPIRNGMMVLASGEHEDELSLAEFEENEKRAASSLSSSTAMAAAAISVVSAKSLHVNIESLIGELRECFVVDEDASNRTQATLYDVEDEDVKARLEEEMVKRLQCEKQIEELNRSLCDARQQLAVASECEKKRNSFARKMDISLNKVFYIKSIKKKSNDNKL